MRTKFFKSLLWLLFLCVCAVVFVITFIDSPYIPSWSEIFRANEKLDADSDIVTFLDVGQGDCILIQSNGRNAMIDTGDGKNKPLLAQLRQNGVNGFDAVMLSHWHDDHYGGVDDVFSTYKVLNFLTPAIGDDKDIAENAHGILSAVGNNTTLHTITPAMAVNIGDFEITILYFNSKATKENNRTAVMMAKCRNYEFLLMGDMETSEENKLLKENLMLDCEVLKLGHHGSKSSTSEEFLDACKPEYAVISVGENNSYNHPHKDVISLLNRREIEYYRTDYDGSIAFDVTGDEISVKTQKQ